MLWPENKISNNNFAFTCWRVGYLHMRLTHSSVTPDMKRRRQLHPNSHPAPSHTPRGSNNTDRSGGRSTYAANYGRGTEQRPETVALCPERRQEKVIDQKHECLKSTNNGPIKQRKIKKHWRRNIEKHGDRTSPRHKHRQIPMPARKQKPIDNKGEMAWTKSAKKREYERKDKKRSINQSTLLEPT